MITIHNNNKKFVSSRVCFLLRLHSEETRSYNMFELQAIISILRTMSEDHHSRSILLVLIYIDLIL